MGSLQFFIYEQTIEFQDLSKKKVYVLYNIDYDLSTILSGGL